jgi:hypothetical protein
MPPASIANTTTRKMLESSTRKKAAPITIVAPLVVYGSKTETEPPYIARKPGAGWPLTLSLREGTPDIQPTPRVAGRVPSASPRSSYCGFDRTVQQPSNFSQFVPKLVRSVCVLRIDTQPLRA